MLVACLRVPLEGFKLLCIVQCSLQLAEQVGTPSQTPALLLCHCAARFLLRAAQPVAALPPCRGLRQGTTMETYGTTKLWEIIVSQELNQRLNGTGVESFACHPGMCRTGAAHTTLPVFGCMQPAHTLARHFSRFQNKCPAQHPVAGGVATLKHLPHVHMHTPACHCLPLPRPQTSSARASLTSWPR